MVLQLEHYNVVPMDKTMNRAILTIRCTARFNMHHRPTLYRSKNAFKTDRYMSTIVFMITKSGTPKVLITKSIRAAHMNW